ncbi:thioredoxin domain-containing protein [Curtobacterium flaccumfaciens]|nr:thioredoxin domain-containing protein [Curtobacterium flaccumfaciens]
MNDNRLGTSVSPYLRLHADNPVDWREWGPEAFAEARERGVPVLVSVGYATCHWCHVMARESFADPEIGELLRQDFVSVKVDREERPDVDASLMASASAFTQQLGWPLTTFLTPDGHVFFAGTYFPPTPVGQVPAFRQILAAVLDAWTERRHEVDANASAIATAIRQGAVADATARSGESGAGADLGLPSVDTVRAVTSQLLQAEDTTYGGFGGAPKFPSTPLLEFLADAAADGDAEADGLLGPLVARDPRVRADRRRRRCLPVRHQARLERAALRTDALRQRGAARGRRCRAGPWHRRLPAGHPAPRRRGVRRRTGQRIDHRRPSGRGRVVPPTDRRARTARPTTAGRPGAHRVERPGDPGARDRRRTAR